MSNAIVISNMDYFASLPEKVRTDVTRWMEVFQLVTSADTETAGIKLAAERMGHLRGFSAANIRTKYYKVKRSGWQVLVNKSKCGRKNVALAIGEHFKRYCQENQRSCQQAYRRMMGDFRGGEYFEDVGTWLTVWQQEHKGARPPKVCPGGYTPRGWTYRNLMRACGLTEYELLASRVGRGAARALLPGVYSTRVGLLPGQLYQFDDMWHDARVNFGANKKARRAIELACLDVASASRIAYGLKPRREDIDSGKLKNLTESDMRMLLAHVLINIGYHPAGCTLVVEHGTAAASKDLELAVGSLSGGAGYIEDRTGKLVWTVAPPVQFQRSGIISDQIHKGLFLGQARGNFKLKAALESQHALMHTAAAALPGQMGMNRDKSPEEQHGMQQYNAQLIKAAQALPPERAKLLRYPFLDFADYASVIGELYDRLDWRTDHHLEGWEHNMATEFRASVAVDKWLPMDEFLQLPGPEQQVLSALIDADPYEYARVRQLSPREVWLRGENELVRLPKSAMPLILGPKLAMHYKVAADGLIKFQNAEYGPGEHRYQARDVQDPAGFQINLDVGREYLVHVNPFNLCEAFISDLQGAFIGIARRWETVAKNDVEALNKQVGKQMHVEAQLRTPLANRAQKKIKARAEMHKHNASVLRGDPITDAELDEYSRIKATKGSLQDVVGDREEADRGQLSEDGDQPSGGLREIF